MPTIQENLYKWGAHYDWTQQGDEWSSPWDGTELLWWGTLFPRIHAFVPTDTILEIAPGFGRITQYLTGLCKNLTVVDIAERCIEICRQRFSSYSHITYHINDGKSLDMIPDQSVDFVISFDSLVHAEDDVIEAYLRQLARKLKPNGVGFIHHSNAGAYLLPMDRHLPPLIKKPLMKKLNKRWRAEGMSAKLFEQYCEDAGLRCMSQEVINWATKYPFLLDCFSFFTQKDSIWARPNKFSRNLFFGYESLYLANLSRLYSTSSFQEK